MPSTIQLEYRGSQAIITLNNPAKLNALTEDDFYQLATYLREIATNPEIVFTILTGKGKYFSAGIDITTVPIHSPLPPHDTYKHHLTTTTAHSINLTRAFYTHPKILITALNGPAIGLPAALIAFSDFIYAAPSASIHIPNSSLGLVADGGATYSFVQRMGIAKANEALLQGRRIPASELVRAGFVNRVLDEMPRGGNNNGRGEEDKVARRFLDAVLVEIRERIGKRYVGGALLETKALMRRRERREMEGQMLVEAYAGLERMAGGGPVGEVRKVRERLWGVKL